VPAGRMGKAVPGLNGVNIKVIWNVNRHLNRIYVVVYKNGKESGAIMIMQFYDHHVNPIAGATKSGDENEFKIDKIVKAVNPHIKSRLAEAPPTIRQAIEQETETFMRALLATVSRKSMEFKSKSGRKVFPLTWDDSGKVTYKDAHGNSITIKQNDVINILKGNYDIAKKWEDSLDYAGYFGKFNTLKPIPIVEQGEFLKALSQMVMSGVDENSAKSILISAWIELRRRYNKSPDNITAADLINVASGTATPPAPAPPAPASKGAPPAPGAPTATPGAPTSPGAPTATPSTEQGKEVYRLAKTVLEKRGLKNVDIILQKAYTELIKTKKENEIKAEDFFEQVLFQKYTEMVTSLQNDGINFNTKNITPVFQKLFQKNPNFDYSEFKQEILKVSTLPANKSTSKNNGKIEIEGNELVWENPTSHEIHHISSDQIEYFVKTKPKFLAALQENPEIYKKYKEMINKAIQSKKQKDTSGEKKNPIKEFCVLINPFNFDNLIY